MFPPIFASYHSTLCRNGGGPRRDSESSQIGLFYNYLSITRLGRQVHWCSRLPSPAIAAIYVQGRPYPRAVIVLWLSIILIENRTCAR